MSEVPRLFSCWTEAATAPLNRRQGSARLLVNAARLCRGIAMLKMMETRSSCEEAAERQQDLCKPLTWPFHQGRS